jgi:hypothetical protein
MQRVLQHRRPQHMDDYQDSLVVGSSPSALRAAILRAFLQPDEEVCMHVCMCVYM